MLTHILFANLHLGGAWILLSLIILYFISSKERYGHLGRSMALFNVILFSAGATFAAAGVLFFISLYPTFATQGFHIYWWPLLVEAISSALRSLRLRPLVRLGEGLGSLAYLPWHRLCALGLLPDLRDRYLRLGDADAGRSDHHLG